MCLALTILCHAMPRHAMPRHAEPCYAHLRRTLALQGAPWCFQPTAAWTLNGDYLIQWGGRWGPFMKSQPHRWVLSRLKSTMKLSIAHTEAGVLPHEELGDTH